MLDPAALVLDVGDDVDVVRPAEPCGQAAHDLAARFDGKGMPLGAGLIGRSDDEERAGRAPPPRSAGGGRLPGPA